MNWKLLSLPPLPNSLTYLSFTSGYPLLMPELPAYLEQLHCYWNEVLECRINESNSEYIARFKEIKRTITRVTAIKEALMERCWHPDRLTSMIERFGTVSQWNHELREYGTFNFMTMDEVL